MSSDLGPSTEQTAGLRLVVSDDMRTWTTIRQHDTEEGLSRLMEAAEAYLAKDPPWPYVVIQRVRTTVEIEDLLQHVTATTSDFPPPITR